MGPQSGGSPAVHARRSRSRILDLWLNLCQWDPAVPPGVRPPVAEALIEAVADALDRPQPLGWGVDPAIPAVAERFGSEVGEVRASLALLVCLREAFTRVVIDSLAADARLDAYRRLQMLMDRTMLAVADTGVRRLSVQALTDELTGLANRWAFEEDLAGELQRVGRSGQPLTLGVLDVDGLKVVNDTLGHPEGDRLLRRVGSALLGAIRSSDHAYRIGGDEFAVLLHDAAGMDVEQFTTRLTECGCPAVTVGLASVPGDDPGRLVEIADRRLYDRRRRRAAC